MEELFEVLIDHTGKRSEERSPSKNNLLGSQGLEAKMRVVLELRADPYNREIRHLCVLKGNYLAAELKEKSYVLQFDKNLRFHNNGQQEDFADLAKAPEQNANERELLKTAKELLDAGNSYSKVAELLIPVAKTLGVSTLSKATLNRRLPRTVPHLSTSPSETPSENMAGCPVSDNGLSEVAIGFTRDEVQCLFVSGNTLTTEQLLDALQAQHGGDTTELLTQLQRGNYIEPTPSNKAGWRLTSPTL